MRRKSLYKWVRENRAMLDEAIRSRCRNTRLNDEERRMWVLNDEALYNQARAAGVNV